MKKGIIISICALLAFLILAWTRTVNSNGPVFSVTPSVITVDSPGESFTINITVTGAPTVDFWMVNVTWNAAVLNISKPYASKIVEGSFFKSNGTTVFVYQDPIPGAIADMGCGFLTGGPASGDGVLVSITFDAIAVGESPINLDFGYMLNGMQYVEVALVNGSVNVIPEFPHGIIIPVFLISTVAIALTAKILMTRKRQIIMKR